MDPNALNDLYAQLALGSAKEKIAADNPWAGPSQFAGGLNQAIIQAASNPQYSTGEKIGAALVGGLIGGGLEGAGKNWQSGAEKDYASVFSQALAQPTGSVFERPQGVKSSIFDMASGDAGLFGAKNAIEEQIAEKKRNSEFEDMQREERFKYGLENPQMMALANKLQAQKEGAGAPGATPDSGEGIGIKLNPAEELVLNGQAKNIVEANKLIYDREQAAGDDELKLQQRFLSLDPVKDFQYKFRGAGAFMEALKDPAGTSDYELIRRGAQAVEPALAVRRDDEESIQRAASLFGTTTQQMRSWITGETKLTPDQRKGLARVVKRAYESDRTEYERLKNQFGEVAKSRSFDPGFVTTGPEPIPFDERFSGIDIGGGSTQATQAVQGLSSAQLRAIAGID